MRLSTSIFTHPTTTAHPPKFYKEPVFRIQAIKRSPGPIQELGIQKEAEKDLSKILRTEFAIKNIEKKVSSKKYKNLWPKPVLEALDEAIKQKKWQLALKIFGLLRQQQWYQARCQTFTKLIVMLGKCKQPDQASLLFEVMLSDGLKPSVDVYTALVSAYGHSGLLDEAFSTINDMKSVSACKPDVYTYSILIKSCTKFHRFDLIEKILAEMSYLGIECSAVTSNTIIDGYGKAKKFEEMESSFSAMVESGGCHPDIFTLNSMISAYGNSGNIEKMEKWYNEFNLMGVKADIQTLNILTKSYGRAGMYDKMRSVMDFMQKRFFFPTVVTYNIVIETFGKAGHIEKMEEYFKKMKHRGMKPNSITYCSLVSAYSKAGLIMKVDSILRQVENSDVILDTPFFNCIISAYGQAGDVEKMGELFLTMKERHCVPDNITFATMIQAYNALGMTEAAQNLENKMIAMKENSGKKLIQC
ncbi:pentatricopeptide repeat-containing protein [Citrus sinensis]|uniref:pentatricopeptide repeat-containing protein At3g53170 n=1 Tax=Citrus sinensis TaxID=2711 RepID=UPI00218E37FA|nr:pentatricopeptide repeat-containing protein At3g53170 [Citrus sinensis]KAH9726966.1 pentatricopeptide repeat-containing protein [Citrus sinensis]